MKVDPAPHTADPTLERRLQELFREDVPTREPERLGLWLNPETGELNIKYEGKVYTYGNPTIRVLRAP